METFKPTGDNPYPRFGHTITLISKAKAILFGGATGDTGKYSITGDTFIYDLQQRKWAKLDTKGQKPPQRAAHAATTVENLQMVIYGGAVGGGGLVPDDLYFLDLRKGEQNCNWMVVPVVGTTPGRRYGHSIVYSKPFIVIFGGNTGSTTVNDVWALNIEKTPFCWTKIECNSDAPTMRVYHSASLCSTGSANGMMVVYGGRGGDQSALNDTWGFRRHRDGKWDWVKAPYKSSNDIPKARYQHSIIFQNTLMIVVGGRTNQVGETLNLEVYDTETSEWNRFNLIQRFRHAAWILDSKLYIHGGFDQETPNVPTDAVMCIDLTLSFQNHPGLLKCLVQMASEKKPGTVKIEEIDKSISANIIATSNKINRNKHSDNLLGTKSPQLIRFSPHVVVAETYNQDEDINRVISKKPISSLQDEPRKLGIGFQDPNTIYPEPQIELLSNTFLSALLLPNDFTEDFKFPMKKEQIQKLCMETQKQLERDPVLIKLSPPLKIFGSIYGQFGDLMKLFREYYAPTDEILIGDIERINYLFLGDYVDRGKFSLETICLLFALKVKYPDHIYLLRGHHEDKKINKMLGFAEECAMKLSEDITDPNSVYARINKVFEYLPLAAVVDEKIFCVHGGIGNSLKSIEDIDSLERPIEIVHKPTDYVQQIVLDMLWSDPVHLENEIENIENPNRDLFTQGKIIRFGFKRLRRFLAENNLLEIIRSHEGVSQGYEKLSHFISTLNSHTNYCGKIQNAACCAVLKKDLGIVSKPIVSENTNIEKKWWNFEAIDEKKAKKEKADSFEVSIFFDKEELAIRKRPPTPLRK